MALLPLDYIVVYIAAVHGSDLSDTTLNYFQLFRLFRMVGVALADRLDKLLRYDENVAADLPV